MTGAPSETISRVADDWRLCITESLPGAWCSEVWAGSDATGREIVLKLPNENAEERDSIGTLLSFAKCGGVEILRHDPETRAMLMPRLRPGSTLNAAGLPDDEALDVCCALIEGLRTAAPCHAMTPETWFEKFLIEGPSETVRLCRFLIDSTTQWTLLHGDLHHGNILRHDDRWVVIDPKGIWGDPAFEPCSFVRNPIEWVLADPDPEATASRRIERFAARLGDPVERIWAWAYVQTTECAFGASERTAPAWRRVTDALWAIGDSYRTSLGC